MDDILDYLLGIVGSILDYIQALAAFLVQLVQYVADILYNIILGIVEFLYGLFKILLSGFLHIIRDLFTGNFQQLWQDILNLRAALQAFFQPILAAIRAEQLFLQHLFNLYLRPVLAFIGALRNVLGVLRRMGLKWAGALDDYLGKIEGYIITAYQTIIQAINRHADIFEVLLSPLGFLRLIPLLHIVWLRAEDLGRMFTGASLSMLLSGTDAGGTPSIPTKGIGPTFATLKVQIANNTGDAADWLTMFEAHGRALDADPGA